MQREETTEKQAKGQKKILVVDDHDFTRRALSFPLLQEGYDVKEAVNGEKGLDLLLDARRKNMPFDMLITDIQMPIMSGIELLESLVIHKIYLEVVVISGQIDEDILRKIPYRFRQYCFTKPIKLGKLVNHVQNVFKDSIAQSGFFK